MSDFKVGYNVKTVYGEGTVVFIDTDGMLLVDLGDDYNGHAGNGKHYRQTCKWFTELELFIKNSEHGERSETPEPLENWKHPYYGKPILVRDYEDDEWMTKIFSAYAEGRPSPIIDSEGWYWKQYKFLEPAKPIELTQEELLQIAAEAKGVDVEQIKIKE